MILIHLLILTFFSLVFFLLPLQSLLFTHPSSSICCLLSILSFFASFALSTFHLFVFPLFDFSFFRVLNRKRKTTQGCVPDFLSSSCCCHLSCSPLASFRLLYFPIIVTSFVPCLLSCPLPFSPAFFRSFCSLHSALSASSFSSPLFCPSLSILTDGERQAK